MDYSGEAADRIIRISMDGAMYAVKISGTGAKYLAAILSAVAKQEHKMSGMMKLNNMLKQNKELKVYTLTENQFKEFSQEVKRFGVTYCVLRDRDEEKKHPLEIMIKAEDAAKVARIFERLGFASVDTKDIESEIERSAKEAQEPPEQAESADISKKANDEIVKKESGEQMPPFPSQTSPSPPSEYISEKREKEGRSSAERTNNKRKSVKGEIAEIKKNRRSSKGTDMREREALLHERYLPIDMRYPDRNIRRSRNREGR